MTHFNDVATLIRLQIWEGVTARVWRGDNAALAALELDAGSTVPEHSHPQEQIGILMRGSMTFRIGDESRELHPGSTWVVPSAVPHEVLAVPAGALVVELFAPPREDWEGLPTFDPSPIEGF